MKGWSVGPPKLWTFGSTACSGQDCHFSCATLSDSQGSGFSAVAATHTKVVKQGLATHAYYTATGATELVRMGSSSVAGQICNKQKWTMLLGQQFDFL